ncbi:MAG: hypothetical protein ACREEP_00930 [Dongiaceae bacterium]
MALVDAVQAAATRQPSRAFFSPTLDFLGLGGGALLLLPILAWMIPDSANARALFVSVLLANVINQPHFAHSYQIFYRTFRSVVSDPGSDRKLYARYLWAGLGAPIFLTVFFVVALKWGGARTLGYAGNAMLFFVGWHYVKQGYGMLMVDAALRRSFFGEADKKILLINSYVCWAVSWLAANKAVAERDFWGLAYATIDVPIGLLWLGAVALVITTLFAAWTLFHHARAHRGGVPANGIAAYVAALYPWIFMVREPVLGAFIPAMHSLQYLVIVWRYQLNLEQAKLDAAEHPAWIRTPTFAPTKATVRFAGFALRAVALGLFGFWVLPIALSMLVPYDRGQYGDYLFFFVLIIFINIHHYFIDNAMWRKENPHTLRHLFSHR